jgi:hypothetical protein
VRWTESLPEDFIFTNVPESVEHIPGGRHHTYKTLWIARTWNMYRCARILVNEVRIRCLSGLNVDFGYLVLPELHKSSTILTILCSDICASIPAQSESDSIIAAVGLSLLWPLYVVATTTNVSAQMRGWVILKLREISSKTAILQGSALADELITKWEITSWKEDHVDVEDERVVAI